jgi:hypothetical protein
MSACSSACGWCGRCSEAWERGTKTPAAPKVKRCKDCGAEFLPMDALLHAQQTGHSFARPTIVAKTSAA